jgi:DNA-binding IclR family transcriptional regulator
LNDKLTEIRERGYSHNHQESTIRLSGVGVPVFDGDDTVLGALSVVGATNRIKGNRLTKEIPELLLAAANELGLDIEHA